MHIIDAYWEKRNLGLPVCEIIFEDNDSVMDYLLAEIENKFRYSVAKIPSANLPVLHYLEDIGYNFIETQFNICVEAIELYKMDKKWIRLTDGTGYQKVHNVQDLDIILTNIREGLFNNDRISLDEKLGKGVSAARYINWIKDLYKDIDSEIFYLTKQDKKVGFFVIQKGSKNCIKSVIAAVFSEFQGHGLSVAVIYYYLKLAMERNVKYIFTSFSSNNTGMLNAFTKTVSFKTLKIYYVLRKVIEVKE